MQLNYERLVTHLSQQLARVYLIHGDEPLLVQEACLAIRAKAKQANFLEQIRFTVDNHFNWSLVADQLANLSLFSQQQLIELHLTTALNSQGSQLLVNYLQQANDETMLLLVSNRLTNAQLQTNWCKSIDKNGVIVAIWPITQAQLPQWLKQQMAVMGLKIAPAGLDLLTDYCNGNLLAARQLLEKLKLLAPAESITTDTIQQLMNDSARFTVFELVDVCLLGDASQALRILTKLKEEAAEPPLILWSLAREIRILATLAEQISQGKSLSSALASQGANNKRSALLSKALQNTAATLWLSLLKRCAKIDEINKGLTFDNIWDQLQQLCIQFALRKIELFTLNQNSNTITHL